MVAGSKSGDHVGFCYPYVISRAPAQDCNGAATERIGPKDERGTMSKTRGRQGLALAIAALAATGCGALRETEMMSAYRASHMAYDRGDYAKALSDIDRAISLDPGFATLRSQRAVVLIRQQKPEMAIADLDLAIGLDPKDSVAVSNRCRVKVILDRLDDARADCEDAVRLAPERFESWISRAIWHRAQDDHDRALADLNRAVELAPNDAWARIYRGATLVNSNSPESALVDLQMATRLDPGIPDTKRYICWAMTALRRWNEARADCDDAIRLDPQTPENWISRAMWYRATGDLNSALADLDRAVEARPGRAPALASRGATYLAQDRPDRALPDLDAAIRINPGIRGAMSDRCSAKVRLKRLEAARADCDDAVRLAPRSAKAWRSRASWHRARGDDESASADLRKAIELDPKYAALHTLRCRALGDMDRLEEAIAHCIRAIELELSPEAHLEKAGIEKRAGRFQAAVEEIALALARNPKHAEALRQYMSSLEDLGDYRGAIAAARALADLPLSSPWDIHERGHARMKLGRFAEAKSDYEEVFRATRRTSPGHAALSLAYFLASVPDLAFRDGKRALALVEEAEQVEGQKRYFFYLASAAAHAETGRYEKAIELAQKALAQAPKQRTEPVLAARNLALYRVGKPSRIQTLLDRHPPGGDGGLPEPRTRVPSQAAFPSERSTLARD
jgi:tetratricopeptide (TPR) repeat protein